MFDCTQVIFAQRRQRLTEGMQLILELGDGNTATFGPICTALLYHQPEGGEDRHFVEATFEDNTIHYIFDIDEIVGHETETENL